MKVLMMGCSYGVPNFAGPPGDPPHTHLEQRLVEAGHTVYNLSLNGASNFEIFDRVDEYLAGIQVGYGSSIKWSPGLVKPEDFSVDLIIWFQTSMLRDLRDVNKFMSDYSEQFAHETYERLFNLKKKLGNPPLIAIGGVAPLYDFFSDYGECLLVIDNLIEYLLQEPIPFSHLFGAMHTAARYRFSKDPRLDEEITNANVVADKVKASELFPDDSHPGGKAHQILFDHISEVINNRLL